MRLIRKELVHEFSTKHSDAASALDAWVQTVETNMFKTPIELKKTFGMADYVKPHTIFDVSGNKYRLISVVNYKLGTIFIKCILTHAEYDNGDWRD
ncbi:MAG: hypothetical protein A3G34_15380 [Candidatus Lindowbacteria bacterium RIFCSPLOWO2_12_FULL_62_27]|nr:MAG: hypothetical protein A3G34_15380 [Candidatus Lindowbacteria bacterium RIFCSPLOWO2_12_FULL_62_27]OGH63906.1 MAG: hypothetical protein A3I06_05030 [Candidatus Lindowbacteria bacterium RIFCSPLOWO2_02_FULL_62_12]